MANIEINKKEEHSFPIIISNSLYEKLLAVQSYPEEKYWFKDKEIEFDKLTELLESIQSD